jgi:hypothetical protein
MCTRQTTARRHRIKPVLQYSQLSKREKERERIKQPLFQFRYEGKTGKFIREIKDNASVDNATKDPNFLNGFFTTPGDDSYLGDYQGLTKTPDDPLIKDEGSTDSGSTLKVNTAEGPSGTTAGDPDEKLAT